MIIKLSYHPFGMQMPARSYSSESYRYGFNGQEKVDELNPSHTTAEYWEYDTRLGRRWNVDPVTKPWLSGYLAFSNMPIWKIDPNGDDDYFNNDGSFSHRTETGSKIFVVTNGDTKKFSEFSASKSNMQASANIVGYYRKAANIDYVSGVSTRPNNIAYSDRNNRMLLSVGDGKGVNRLMNDSKNLTNTIQHESYHLENGDPNKDEYTYKEHLNVYDKQMEQDVYKETTADFKTEMVSNYAAYLLGGMNSGNLSFDEVEARVKNVNELNKDFGVEINFNRDSHPMKLSVRGFTEKGEDTVNQINEKNAKTDPH